MSERSDERGTLSRDEVSVAGLTAWAGPDNEGVSEFYFDGEFWRRAGSRDRRVHIRDAPPVGWWHARGCSCYGCTSRSAA